MSRESHEWVRLLRWLTLAERAVPDKMRTVRDVVLLRVQAFPGSTSRQLADAVRTHVAHVREVLNRMQGEGVIKKTGSDRLGRKWWVVEPKLEADK